MSRFALVVVLALVFAGVARADCGCPARATVPRALVSIEDADTGLGVVACGAEESRSSEGIVASEVGVWACGASEPLLFISAAHSALVVRDRGTLKVMQLSKWPFGKSWEWIDVPVFEWRIRAAMPLPPRANVVLPTPAVTTEEIQSFLRESREGLANEETVGRMFAAAISGNAEAIAFFSRKANLDDHAGETYTAAKVVLDAWRASK